MTHAESALDPEVATLVREVLQDPNSVLLRMTPAQRRAAIYDHDPRPGAIRDQLSARERKIYESYREEVAQYLLELAARMIRDDVKWRDFIGIHTSDNKRWEPSSSADLGAIRARLASEGVSHGESDERLRFLKRTPYQSQSDRSTAVELAGAALRLGPSYTARIYFGLGLIQLENELSRARINFQRIASDACPGIYAMHAWANIGLICFQTKNLERSLLAYQESIRFGNHSGYLASCFAIALATGDRSCILRTGAAVESRIVEDSDTFKDFVSMTRTRTKQPSRSVIQVTSRQIEDLTRGLGPVARRLANEFI